MDRSERFYAISNMLHRRLPVTPEMLKEQFEVSQATVVRDIKYMRERLHMPIVWDYQDRRYRLEDDGMQTELPGLWFNSAEAVALLSMEHLLSQLGQGLLTPHLEPLRQRIQQLLGSGEHSYKEVTRCLRVLPHPPREVSPAHFKRVAQAVLARQRLRIRHRVRASGETLEREISPQRLVYYRNCWYMDAWCHLRLALRTFGLDALEEVTLLKTQVQTVSEEVLDQEMTSGYGIYAGSKTFMAHLRFSADAAQYVKVESWHPQQEGRFDAQGRYLLSFPYAKEFELVMDILRHGPEVEVLGPPSLRQRVQVRLKQAMQVYQD